jgi:hypothetical protein
MTGTVASRPKILQNNSKPAVEKSDWPGEFGGRSSAVFRQKRQKTGRKNLDDICLINYA